MISGVDEAVDPLARDRMLVVGSSPGGRDLIDDIRARYPDWSIAACDTYMAGIAELSRRPARAVLACVDPSLIQLDNAVAALREAGGEQTRLILCCTTESEPVARRVMASGADDYILYPLDAEEIDAAIGYAHLPPPTDAVLAPAPSASMEEMAQLGEVLAGIGDKPMTVIERIAPLIRMALSARGVTVVVEGAVATSGDVITKPVLTAPLEGRSGAIGQLSVGERESGAYTPGDVEKLSHYATVVGHILEAAAKQRQWHKLALTDECSGLGNRRYLYSRLDEILARAAAEHFHVTVLLFDVDDLKTYNDAFGHDAGDEIIHVTGRLFQEHCREQDVVVRYGGDEFVVVFWDPDGPRVAGSRHPEGALAVLERFNEALRSQRFPRLGPSGVGCLTISGGLATYPWDAATRPELLERADQALLAAKRAGKNRIFLIGDAEAGPA